MDTKQLRQKILDLAIRGKLVPQDPNDEPASVLLERVKAEKERLIAEGKIKRSKKSASSSDKPHYPFEIPNGWAWTLLSDITSIGTGATPSTRVSAYYEDGTIPWIGSSETSYEYIDSPTTFITRKALEETNCTVYPIGTIIMAMYGEGKTRGQVSELRISCATNQACAAIVPLFNELKSFIKIFLQGNYLRLRTLAEGGMQPNLNLGKISSYLIPIPPLNEQQRIVNEVERWYSVIKILENETSLLSVSLNYAKSKILELAISGKLVPQDPVDEPAEELLRRINPSVVSADTSHYQHLPQGWCVCKLEDIVDYEQPQRYIVESTEYNDAYKTPVLTAGKSFVIGHTNETEGVFDKVPVIIFDDFTTDSKYVDFSFKVKSSAMKILHVKSGVNIKYVYFFMSITRLAGKTHKRYWISEYSKLVIQLPPYNEQCRIVDAIERINNRIDDIAEAL